MPGVGEEVGANVQCDATRNLTKIDDDIIFNATVVVSIEVAGGQIGKIICAVIKVDETANRARVHHNIRPCAAKDCVANFSGIEQSVATTTKVNLAQNFPIVVNVIAVVSDSESARDMASVGDDV